MLCCRFPCDARAVGSTTLRRLASVTRRTEATAEGSSFSKLIGITAFTRKRLDDSELNLDYVCLAPGFVKEVLETYDAWDEKETTPWKIRELMTVLRIEISRLYKRDVPSVKTESPDRLKDTKLG